MSCIQNNNTVIPGVILVFLIAAEAKELVLLCVVFLIEYMIMIFELRNGFGFYLAANAGEYLHALGNVCRL